MEGDRLFASQVGELIRAERKNIKESPWRFACQFQMAVATEGKRLSADQSIRRIRASYSYSPLLIPTTRPFLSPIPSAPPVMLRANQRPPSILGDDPFSHAFKPPAYESDYEKHARLEREIEAKRISDRIDDEIRKDKERFKRSKQDVKVRTRPYNIQRKGPFLTGLAQCRRSSYCSARLSLASPPFKSSSSSSTLQLHSTQTVLPGRLLSFTTSFTQSGASSTDSKAGAISSTRTSANLGRTPRRRAIHLPPSLVPPSRNCGFDLLRSSPLSKSLLTG